MWTHETKHLKSSSRIELPTSHRSRQDSWCLLFQSMSRLPVDGRAIVWVFAMAMRSQLHPNAPVGHLLGIDEQAIINIVVSRWFWLGVLNPHNTRNVFDPLLEQLEVVLGAKFNEAHARLLTVWPMFLFSLRLHQRMWPSLQRTITHIKRCSRHCWWRGAGLV